MNRAHFILSSEPVTELQTVAACGEAVERIAEIASDQDLRYVSLSTLTGCKKCRAELVQTRARYIYVGISR